MNELAEIVFRELAAVRPGDIKDSLPRAMSVLMHRDRIRTDRSDKGWTEVTVNGRFNDTERDPDRLVDHCFRARKAVQLEVVLKAEEAFWSCAGSDADPHEWRFVIDPRVTFRVRVSVDTPGELTMTSRFRFEKL